jgi:hypothetical protein
MTMLRRPALALYPTSPIWAALDGEVDRRMGSKALPGRLPPKGPWLDYRVQWPNAKRPVTLSGSDQPKQMPLRLLRKGDLLTLEAPKGVNLHQEPSERLLVRWWHEDKPVAWQVQISESTPRSSRKLHARLVHVQTAPGLLRIEPAIPPWILAEPGDKISLQLMWAPGYLNADQPGKLSSDVQTLDDQIHTGPLLSDILTFRATKPMLERGKELQADQSKKDSKSSENK